MPVHQGRWKHASCVQIALRRIFLLSTPISQDCLEKYLGIASPYCEKSRNTASHSFNSTVTRLQADSQSNSPISTVKPSFHQIKMKLSLFAIASLGSVAFALPTSPAGYHGGHGRCLSQDAAETLVAEYRAVIGQVDSDLGDPVTTAQQIIARNYQESSDSANSQLGIPVRGSLLIRK